MEIRENIKLYWEEGIVRIGVMQPYLFPYIGYFQLINAVDKFVIYDDAQYIKHGWINRNRILINNNECLFTFSVKKAPHNLNINERYFSERFHYENNKFLKTLEASYKKTENYADIISLIEESLNIDVKNQNVAEVIKNIILTICNYLDINTSFLSSSQIPKKKGLTGEEHIIEINKLLGSTHYINPIGGRELYSSEKFQKKK